MSNFHPQNKPISNDYKTSGLEYINPFAGYHQQVTGIGDFICFIGKGESSIPASSNLMPFSSTGFLLSFDGGKSFKGVPYTDSQGNSMWTYGAFWAHSFKKGDLYFVYFITTNSPIVSGYDSNYGKNNDQIVNAIAHVVCFNQYGEFTSHLDSLHDGSSGTRYDKLHDIAAKFMYGSPNFSSINDSWQDYIEIFWISGSNINHRYSSKSGKTGLVWELDDGGTGEDHVSLLVNNDDSIPPMIGGDSLVVGNRKWELHNSPPLIIEYGVRRHVEIYDRSDYITRGFYDKKSMQAILFCGSGSDCVSVGGNLDSFRVLTYSYKSNTCSVKRMKIDDSFIKTEYQNVPILDYPIGSNSFNLYPIKVALNRDTWAGDIIPLVLFYRSHRASGRYYLILGEYSVLTNTYKCLCILDPESDYSKYGVSYFFKDIYCQDASTWFIPDTSGVRWTNNRFK